MHAQLDSLEALHVNLGQHLESRAVESDRLYVEDTCEVPSSVNDTCSPRKQFPSATFQGRSIDERKETVESRHSNVDMSPADAAQVKLRKEIEEVYQNLEMIMRTENLNPDERR